VAKPGSGAENAKANAPGRATEGEQLRNSAIKQFYWELQAVFRKHYPKVTHHWLGDKIHFECDTQVFIVHEPRKTGEWQGPSEERGPKSGGILCDMTLQKGEYRGQASVPRTLDRPYFKVLLMAPYSSKQDAHLKSHLCYPQGVSADFLKQFTELANDFGKYVEWGLDRQDEVAKTSIARDTAAVQQSEEAALAAYREFEKRAGLLTTMRGAKTAMVMDAIERLPDGFKMVDLERACPNVTREMIRVVLNRLKTDKKIHCEEFGGAAIWKKGQKRG
jgi:hypothetical protein